MLNPASNPDPGHSDPLPLAGAVEDAALLSSEFLSREEVLRRRSRRAKQLARYYRDQYWALVEEVRVKISDYYRSFGIGPRVVDATPTPAVAEGSGDNDEGAMNKVFCRFSDCQSTAMPLTRYCYLHILCDSKQTLYKPCTFATCRFDLVLNVVLVEAFG
ncbi:hypothetical protein ZIOFF_027423 [Zingiber officinale]|uniref:KAT8 regulatory NSL complex subunit 2 n=1 Tax=Zingiber officinale TaxID=94328 RepID=A0A8J5GLL4_ZINOF|nr:hypothetical protein ZIOFF_027421 [Zingiber officinale]KAG6509433.1 hypothetical protein ZIOFF_027423 [Zingiber officinale]